MEAKKLILNCRIDESPIIIQFTIDLVNGNITDLSTYRPTKYVPAFVTELEAGLVAVNSIVNPVVLTGELQLISIALTENVIGLRQTMNLLEGYVKAAVGLTVPVGDFGIKAVRAKISSFDVEGLDGALKVVLINIENNMTALTAVDYTPAMKSALKNTKEAIFSGNAAQKQKMDARAELVVKNIDKINSVLELVKGVLSDGVSLYRATNKTKYKMFTLADMIRKIRNDQLHTLITGMVTDLEGKPVKKVKIVARPSTEGKRGKTVYTKADGIYELKGLKPVNYVMTFTFPNGKIFVANADAITNETVTLNFKE